MSNQLRFQVVEEAFKKKALEVPTPSERPSEYFGKYVFNRQKMFKYLPAEVYRKMIDVMDNGASLDRSIADAVALGMGGDSRKARRLRGARRQGRNDGELRRQAARTAGA